MNAPCSCLPWRRVCSPLQAAATPLPIPPAPGRRPSPTSTATSTAISRRQPAALDPEQLVAALTQLKATLTPADYAVLVERKLDAALTAAAAASVADQSALLAAVGRLLASNLIQKAQHDRLVESLSEAMLQSALGISVTPKARNMHATRAFCWCVPFLASPPECILRSATAAAAAVTAATAATATDCARSMHPRQRCSFRM